MRRINSMLLLGLAPLFFCGSATAALQVANDKAQVQRTEEVPLQERVKSYYQNILNGNRMAALELVAPASKNQFFNSRYDGLADVRIADYEFDPTGDRATVKVVRVSKVPKFGQALDLEFNDVWQRMNGQWYLVLPPPGEMDTPFGKVRFNTESKPNDLDAEQMKRHIEQTYKNVDPEQYIRALQKVEGKSETAQPKPDEKQDSRPSTSPTPKEEKPPRN